MKPLNHEVIIHDYHPERKEFVREVLLGLGQSQKTLPCKYFYNEEGSRLFNQICETKEYYLTRTELAIMETYAAQMAAACQERCLLIEYGSGSGEKTQLLLSHLQGPVGYVPIDISKEHLADTANRLRELFPHIAVIPVCADFTADFVIPTLDTFYGRRIIYFPGSTIGNFSENAAVNLLNNMRNHCRPGDGALIGIDFKKDEEILNRAYNDSEGYTEAFNLNLLKRINGELDADFDLKSYEHQAYYNEHHGRMEMHLVSRENQTVTVEGQTFRFQKGESIHTESSHKYDLDDFSRMAARSRMGIEHVWSDPDGHIGVLLLNMI